MSDSGNDGGRWKNDKRRRETGHIIITSSSSIIGNSWHHCIVVVFAVVCSRMRPASSYTLPAPTIIDADWPQKQTGKPAYHIGVEPYCFEPQ